MTKNSTPTKVKDRKDGGALQHLWRSPWTVWVGFRYLKSKKNSRFLSFITILSMMGVGLGVTAMIVVLSVMDGFEAELKKRMMTSDLHILIQPVPETPGYDSGFIPKKVLSSPEWDQFVTSPQSGIQKLWPVLSTEAILKFGRKVTGLTLKGVTQERIDQLGQQLVESADPKMLFEKKNAEGIRLPGIFIGQELAYEMGLIPGDQITLVSPTEMEGPLESVPRLKRFAIEGIYHGGLPEQELHIAYAKEDSVRSFLRRNEVVSQWEVEVKNFDHAPEIADQIRKLAPTLKVQDWVQLNSHLFASLRLERFSMFVILAFIIIVASFNIVTTLTLMVLEKKKEISILKAIGARNGEVAAVFLAEGILIGAVGVGGGTLLGWVICILLKHFEFITLPDIYYDRTLPVTFNGLYYVLVSVCALLIVLSACLYPSRRAARLNPLDGIRFG